MELSRHGQGLDLSDSFTVDQASEITYPLRTASNPGLSVVATSAEVIRTPSDRFDSTPSPELNSVSPQMDDGNRRFTPHRQQDLEHTRSVAEKNVRKRKPISHEEDILSGVFTDKQIAQLHELAANTATVQVAITSPSRSSEPTILAAFGQNVGRLSSLAYLKTLLDGYRTNAISTRDHPTSDASHMSPARRMIIIDFLDRGIALQCFLRTYHLYMLMSENGYGLDEAESGFVTHNPERQASQAKRQRGNPVQNQRAQLCKSMMKDLFPHLSEGHPQYARRYRQVRGMRRIGHRLGQLVFYFGEGLFGLVPLEGTPENLMIGLLNHT